MAWCDSKKDRMVSAAGDVRSLGDLGQIRPPATAPRPRVGICQKSAHEFWILFLKHFSTGHLNICQSKSIVELALT